MTTLRTLKDRRGGFVQLFNSMFEEKNLSLKAKGFIGFCMTKPPNWIFHVNYLCSVLKEGEKAIYSVIQECIEFGYAYRYQMRTESGDFGPYDIIISDSKEEVEIFKKEIERTRKLKKCLPDRPFGDAPNGDARNAPLNNMDIEEYEKQQQQEQDVVVVPSTPEDKDTEQKIALLKQFPLSSEILSNYSLNFSLEDLTNSVEAFRQYESNRTLSNPMGALRNAIEQRWKPNSEKKDPESEKFDKEIIRQKNFESAKILFERHKSDFTKEFNFRVNDYVITIKAGNSYHPLDLSFENCLKSLNEYIKDCGPKREFSHFNP